MWSSHKYSSGTILFLFLTLRQIQIYLMAMMAWTWKSMVSPQISPQPGSSFRWGRRILESPCSYLKWSSERCISPQNRIALTSPIICQMDGMVPYYSIPQDLFPILRPCELQMAGLGIFWATFREPGCSSIYFLQSKLLVEAHSLFAKHFPFSKIKTATACLKCPKLF